MKSFITSGPGFLLHLCKPRALCPLHSLRMVASKVDKVPLAYKNAAFCIKKVGLMIGGYGA